MKYHLIAFVTVAVWGLTFVSTKVLLASFSPVWILFLRFVVGFAALWVLCPRLLKLKQRRHEWLFVAAGLSGITFYYLMENVALTYTTATAAGVIIAASPLFTALLSAVLGDRRAINPWFFTGFAVAMAGLVVVSVATGGPEASHEAATNPALGDLLALGAAFVWAVYSVIVQRISDLGYETLGSTKRIFFWGLLFIVPAVALFAGPLPAPDVAFQLQNLLNFAFLGLVASAACFAIWGFSVKHLGPAVTTTYIYMVPAITATASALILGEPFTATIFLGLVLTISGLCLSQKGSAGKAAKTGEPTAPASEEHTADLG